MGVCILSLLILFCPAFIHSECMPVNYKPNAYFYGFIFKSEIARKFIWKSLALGFSISLIVLVLGLIYGRVVFAISTPIFLITSSIMILFMANRNKEKAGAG